MTTIVTRSGKGSALSFAEVDGNFTNLNDAKVEGPGASVDSELALFNSTSGALLKRATLTGLVKAISGVASAAVAGTDYQAAISATGLLKGAGGGSVSAATAGTDYLAPAAIGVTVQAYDVDTAKTDVAQTFTTPQRGTVTTANSGSFDMSVANNFLCTPTGTVTLTFTNITAGQSGYVTLVNGSNYTISKASAVKVASGVLTALSATGTYQLSYFSPDGTNVYLTASGALS